MTFIDKQISGPDSALHRRKEDLDQEAKDIASVLSKVHYTRQSAIHNSVNNNDYLADAEYFTKIHGVAECLTKRLEDICSELDTLDKIKNITEHEELPNTVHWQWAQDAQAWSKDIFAAIGAIGGFGASLSALLIFTAIRGSLSIISWAFMLFLFALVLPTLFTGILTWASNLPSQSTKLFNTKYFNAAIGITVLSSIFSCVAAFVLLLVSILLLKYSTDPTGENPDLVVSTSSPKWSAIVALVTIFVGFVVSSIPAWMIVKSSGLTGWLDAYKPPVAKRQPSMYHHFFLSPDKIERG